MPDKSSDYEKYKALEELKSQIDSQIRNLEETADENTIEKINKLKNHFGEESDNRTVDENLKYLEKFNKGLSYFERFKFCDRTWTTSSIGRLLW